MKITQADFDRYIIGWHITENGHIWIDGVTGGYTEQMNCGKYYREHNHYNAIMHRIKHIKKMQRGFMK